MTLNVDGKQHISNENVVTFSYDPAWDEPIVLALAQTLPLSEGEMILQALEITPTQTFLYLDFNHPQGDTLDAAAGTLTADGNKTSFVGIAEPSNRYAKYRLTLDALDVIPSALTLEIERAALVSSEQVDFTIDTSAYQPDAENRETPNQFLKEIRNTRIFLESLYSDNRGISFGLLYEMPKKQRQPYTEMIAGGFSTHDGGYFSYAMPHDHRIMDAYADNPPYNQRRFPNVVSAENENGEPAVYGQRGAGPEHRISMFLDSSFVEASETIHVTVSNLPYVLAGRWIADMEIK